MNPRYSISNDLMFAKRWLPLTPYFLLLSKTKKYQLIQDHFKRRIQNGTHPVDSYLPSEHEICQQFSATRTTVRKALDELLRSGYIRKEHGKGSRVVERRGSLGLPTVKGFSSQVDYETETRVTRQPQISQWDDSITFQLTEPEQNSSCVYFQRVRLINSKPVLVENNWYCLDTLELLRAEDFIDGSFFKTLSQKYHIEILGVEQEIHAQPATDEVADKLEITTGDPILFISVRFQTNNPDLNLYGSWYCNTVEFPIVSSHFL